MKSFKKILYPLSPIILLAIIILLAKFGQFHYPKINKKKSNYDVIMKNALTTKYDNLGNKSIVIETPLLKHKKPDDINELSKPKSLIYNSDGSDWTVTADNGSTGMKTNITTLTGNVVMYRPASKIKPETTIYTDKVIYNEKTKIAVCPEHIKMVQPEQTLDYDSAIINMTTNVIVGKKLKVVKKNNNK